MRNRKAWIWFLAVGLIVLGGCAASRSVVYKQTVQLYAGIPFDYSRLTKLVIMDSPSSLRESSRLYVVQQEYVDLDIRAADAEGNLYILPPELLPTWTVMTTVPFGYIELGPLTEIRYPIYMQDANAGREVKGQAIRLKLVSAEVQSPLVVEAILRMRTSQGEIVLHDFAEFEVLKSFSMDQPGLRPTMEEQ